MQVHLEMLSAEDCLSYLASLTVELARLTELHDSHLGDLFPVPGARRLSLSQPSPSIYALCPT